MIRIISLFIAFCGPKIAIVGAGPAGFYAAQHIAKVNTYNFKKY